MKAVTYKNITVFYTPQIEGGGRFFGQDFIPVVKQLFGKVERVCEFGCGPGFIGFSLLAHNLCNTLCLVDINPLAIEACKKTIKKNHLEKRVTTYISDVFANVPKKEKWDLVVSNPPHFLGLPGKRNYDLLIIDPGWRVHKQFYATIGDHLKPNGSVLFQENAAGSDPKVFEKMIKKHSLTFVKTFQLNQRLLRIILQNIRIFIFDTQPWDIWKLMSRFNQMSINLTSVFHILKYRFYFMWSKKDRKRFLIPR